MRKKNLVRILFSTVLICSLWSIPTFAAEMDDLDNIFVTSTAQTESFKGSVDVMQTSKPDVESTLEAIEETKAVIETAEALNSAELSTEQFTQVQTEPSIAETAIVFPTLDVTKTEVQGTTAVVQEKTTIAETTKVTQTSVPETTTVAQTSAPETTTVAQISVPETTASVPNTVESVDIIPATTAPETTIAVPTVSETLAPETISQTESIPTITSSKSEFSNTRIPEAVAPMVIQELLNSDGYSVLKITTRQDVALLRCATWTAEGGQDDLKWTVIDTNGSTENKLYIYDADFVNRAGTYINHIYAYDINGNLLDLQEFDVQITNTNPFLCVDIIENNDNTYTVYVDTTEDIASVACATWTEANGQDDISWKYQMKDNKYRTTFTIPISEHNGEVGKYINHIYATYKNGVIVGPADIMANMVYVEPLSIREIQSSTDFYTGIVRTRSDVKTIGVATWTEENGQDDIVWEFYDTVDKKADFTVNRAAHNNESGKYITHIYSYNYSGDTVGLIGYTISYDK